MENNIAIEEEKKVIIGIEDTINGLKALKAIDKSGNADSRLKVLKLIQDIKDDSNIINNFAINAINKIFNVKLPSNIFDGINVAKELDKTEERLLSIDKSTLNTFKGIEKNKGTIIAEFRKYKSQFILDMIYEYFKSNKVTKEDLDGYYKNYDKFSYACEEEEIMFLNKEYLTQLVEGRAVPTSIKNLKSAIKSSIYRSSKEYKEKIDSTIKLLEGKSETASKAEEKKKDKNINAPKEEKNEETSAMDMWIDPATGKVIDDSTIDAQIDRSKHMTQYESLPDNKNEVTALTNQNRIVEDTDDKVSSSVVKDDSDTDNEEAQSKIPEPKNYNTVPKEEIAKAVDKVILPEPEELDEEEEHNASEKKSKNSHSSNNRQSKRNNSSKK